MAIDPPKPWEWVNEPKPNLLSMHALAPEKIGYYELGLMEGREFIPKYAGRVMTGTFRGRFRAHFLYSKNPDIRANASKTFYRYKVFDDPKVAAFVEAVYIMAMSYPWNRKRELQMNWALEDGFWID